MQLDGSWVGVWGKKGLRIRQPLLQTARPSKGNNFVCLSVSLAHCGLQIFICSVRLAQIKGKKIHLLYMFLLILPYHHTLLSAWAVIAGYEKMKRCAVLRYLCAKVFILC